MTCSQSSYGSWMPTRVSCSAAMRSMSTVVYNSHKRLHIQVTGNRRKAHTNDDCERRTLVRRARGPHVVRREVTSPFAAAALGFSSFPLLVFTTDFGDASASTTRTTGGRSVRSLICWTRAASGRQRR